MGYNQNEQGNQREGWENARENWDKWQEEQEKRTGINGTATPPTAAITISPLIPLTTRAFPWHPWSAESFPSHWAAAVFLSL